MDTLPTLDEMLIKGIDELLPKIREWSTGDEMTETPHIPLAAGWVSALLIQEKERLLEQSAEQNIPNQGPLSVTCPTCLSGPGKPCTTATELTRKKVTWFHSAREA